MAFLANRSVTQRNAAVVASTLTGSTITTSVMTASTLTGSTITASAMGFSTLTGSTTNTSVLGFSTLTGSSIIGTSGQIGSLGYSTLSGSSIVGTIGQIGSLGIGTSSPQSALDVNGVISVGTGANVGGQGININTGWLNPLNYFENAPLKVSVRNTPVFNVNTQGYVGIGTTNPFSALTLVNGESIYIGNSAASAFRFHHNTSNQSFLDFGSGDLFIRTSTGIATEVNRLVITSGGNVGIGISTPNAPLEFAASVASRKIVLFESSNNDHQFYGFGVNNATLRYQVDAAAANHVFYAAASSTTSTELMRIQGNGNVGIGTTSPSKQLHVNATNLSAITGTQIYSSLYLSGTYGTSGTYQGVSGIVLEGGTHYNQNTSLSISRYDNSATRVEIMRIGEFAGAYNVGIGTSNPSYKLHVIGDIYASGNITGLSDRRFKTNIEPLGGALDAVTALNGYTYFRPDHRPEERQMGLIAQEVQEVYPEAVTYDKENDRYGVNYNAMIAPLVQAMKEMRSEYCAQINHLKEEISSLKARLSV